MEKVKSHESEISVEERLRALYNLQLVDSEIDKIKTLRGELPLEVQDLEDEIVGLETRLGNLKEEVVTLDKSVSKKLNEITEAENLIKKYEEQQKNVRNNREFDSLSKEIEYQKLEIELYNKKIKLFSLSNSDGSECIDRLNESMSDNNVGETLGSILISYRKDNELHKQDHYDCVMIYCDSCRTANINFKKYLLNSKKQIEEVTSFVYSLNIDYDSAKSFL
jgi:chromosome segregation ATPase